MPATRFLASGAVALASTIAVTSALAVTPASSVTVRVEGKAKTLLPSTAERLTKLVAVSRSGHTCAARSGAGALTAATKGKWSGPYSSSLKDFEVLTILGDTENYAKTKSYWEVFVNNVAASTGICGLTLKPGAQLLFAAVGATESPALPLGITVRGTTAKVVYYTAKGKAVAASGVTVKSGTTSTTTNAAGKATLPAYAKPTTVTASKRGYIRAEALAG